MLFQYIELAIYPEMFGRASCSIEILCQQHIYAYLAIIDSFQKKILAAAKYLNEKWTKTLKTNTLKKEQISKIVKPKLDTINWNV